MHQVSLILLSTLLACTDDGGTTTDTGASDTGPVTYPSTFTAAKYSAKSLTVLPADQGVDLDDDGEVDNQLPALLGLVDPFTTDDMSVEGVNQTLIEMKAEGSLIMLVDALYAGGELQLDLLLSALDPDTGVLTMDPGSYGSDGLPNSRFIGAFEDQTNFLAATPTGNLAFPVVAGEPPVQVPMVDATMDGELHDLTGGVPDTGHWTAGYGMLYGALPVQGLVDQVVDKIIAPEEPDTGADPDVTYYDPDTYFGMSRDEFLEWVTALLNDTTADLWLEDGSRAVSAALAFELEVASEWPEE